jgi:hypothetical protein
MKIQGIEIKDGYLLVVKSSGEVHNMTVANDKDDELGCFTPNEDFTRGVHYWPVECFDEKGEYNSHKIIAIYGRTTNRYLLSNSTTERELLWELKEPKKMTVAEICKALGFEVEIVKD